jgi:hypothetical protein
VNQGCSSEACSSTREAKSFPDSSHLMMGFLIGFGEVEIGRVEAVFSFIAPSDDHVPTQMVYVSLGLASKPVGSEIWLMASEQHLKIHEA